MLFWLILGFIIIKGAMFISTSLFDAFSPKDSYGSDPNITIINNTVEQHLHITEGQAERLSKKQ